VSVDPAPPSRSLSTKFAELVADRLSQALGPRVCDEANGAPRKLDLSRIETIALPPAGVVE
jgi:hypothetical protein